MSVENFQSRKNQLASKEQIADCLAEKSLFCTKSNELTVQEASLCGAIGMFLPGKSMQIGG